jgi:hypothetical protein
LAIAYILFTGIGISIDISIHLYITPTSEGRSARIDVAL